MIRRPCPTDTKAQEVGCCWSRPPAESRADVSIDKKPIRPSASQEHQRVATGHEVHVAGDAVRLRKAAFLLVLVPDGHALIIPIHRTARLNRRALSRERGPA